jgi:hypothetical protein
MNTILNLRVFLLIASIALLGCSGFPDKNSDPAKNNVATHRVDMRDCAQSYPETADGVYLKQRISCMELKGWK